jgi:hypothetical protein
MLCGRLPFINPHMKALCKMIITSDFTVPDYMSSGIGATMRAYRADCSNLLLDMLDKSAKYRPTMAETLK